MKEITHYLDSILASIGNTFQKKEDKIFKWVFVVIIGLFLFEIFKWIYSYIDFLKLSVLLFVVFVWFALRKHFWANTHKSFLVEKLYEKKERIMYSMFILFFVLLIWSFTIFWEDGFLYLIYFSN